MNSVLVLQHYLDCKCLLCYWCSYKEPRNYRKKINTRHLLCKCWVAAAVQYLCGRSIGWVYLGTAHCSDSCSVAHLVLDTVAKFTVVVTIHYSIMPLPVKTCWVLRSTVLASLRGLAKLHSSFGWYFRIVFNPLRPYLSLFSFQFPVYCYYLLCHLWNLYSSVCYFCCHSAVATVLVKWTVRSAEKENTEALLVTSKGVGAEVNTETTKWTELRMKWQCNVGNKSLKMWQTLNVLE